MELQQPSRKFDAVGVFTTGRIGFSDTFRNVYQAGFRLGIPMVHIISAYWEQCLTHSIQQALKLNPKYILCFDGDSVWDDEDPAVMYDIIDNDDTIDAVCPVQADRNGEKPLAYAWNRENGIEYDYSKPITPILHGHFGLSFIRARVFEHMPLPWLWSQPASDGSWDQKPGKMDADTYFWIKLYEHIHKRGTIGQRVVQANQTVIGHMELHVRWQVGAEVKVQTLGNFYQNGAPYGRRSPTTSEMDEALRPDGPAGQLSRKEMSTAGTAGLPPEPTASMRVRKTRYKKPRQKVEVPA